MGHYTKKDLGKNMRQDSRVLPALSITLLFAFFNMVIYILLALKAGFPIYAMTIILNGFVLPTIFLFLELSGYREILWKLWKSFPALVHIGLCIISFFWILFLAPKALLPAIRKDYDKS